MSLQGLSRLYFRMFGGRSLRDIEQLCLDAWRGTLDAEERATLEGQLDSLAHIQRQAGGVKVCFYYNESASFPLFSDKRPDVVAATVVLHSAVAAARGRMKVQMFTHRGRFFSIEFPKRPDRYLKLHGMDGDSLKVDEVLTHRLHAGDY